MQFDIHDPRESEKVAVSEMLLMERHHLTGDKFRCLADCEPAHIMTAIAALRESARLGDKEDSVFAEQLENINLSDSRDNIQQKIRSVRKKIQQKLLGIEHSDGDSRHEHGGSKCNACIISKKALNIIDDILEVDRDDINLSGENKMSKKDLREIGVLAGSQFLGVVAGEAAKQVPGSTFGQSNSRLVDLLLFGVAPAVASVYVKRLPDDLRTALAVVGTQRIALNVAQMVMQAIPTGTTTGVRTVSVGMPSAFDTSIIQVDR